MKITTIFATLAVGLVASIFASCSGGSSNSAQQGVDSISCTSAQAYSGAIAYVRMDSLIRGYGMYIDMSDAFGKKGKNMEADMTQRGRALEKEVVDYQDKAQKGLVTRYQAQSIEEGLQKKQQELMKYRDDIMGQLQQEEAVMMNTISTAVMDYLKEYNETKRYSVIFQSTANNPILVADPALDITVDILTELNKRYLDTTNKKSKEVAK